VFDLPAERFGDVTLTDGGGGEQFDRAPVVRGEIRIGDRAYAQPERLSAVMEDGGDVLVRAGWNNLRWLDTTGKRLDIIATLRAAEAQGVVDQPVLIGRDGKAPPLALRLVAFAKPVAAAEVARRKARQAARKGGHKITPQTLYAAGWVILVTSLDGEDYSSDDIGTLYRLRWRIELAFKRLKSLAGLRGPPAKDPCLAKVHILAHLLMVLFIEPHLGELDDSPRWALA
jgi:IS4 transposase